MTTERPVQLSQQLFSHVTTTGMDEMTPAEFQAKLQADVIARQNVRRKEKTTGNRASWDYLSYLNPNDKGILKDDA